MTPQASYFSLNSSPHKQLVAHEQDHIQSYLVLFISTKLCLAVGLVPLFHELLKFKSTEFKVEIALLGFIVKCKSTYWLFLPQHPFAGVFYYKPRFIVHLYNHKVQWKRAVKWRVVMIFEFSKLLIIKCKIYSCLTKRMWKGKNDDC